jgi:Uma2 family endonuclease
MTTVEKLPMVVAADWVAGPEQGFWTYAEYAALPDDECLYEVVNGVLYITPAPGWSHQEIVGEIFSYLRSYVRSAGLGGVFMAPIDVELAPNTVFQPDVVVLLKAGRDKLRGNHIVGAPDLVVEAVSPGSAVYDRHDKNVAYAQAGVPEYWIVDPAARTVEVLALEDEKYRLAGVFQGKAVLPSKVLPGFNVAVEKFFESVWS